MKRGHDTTENGLLGKIEKVTFEGTRGPYEEYSLKTGTA